MINTADIYDTYKDLYLSEKERERFVIFNPLSHCLKGTIGFDVKASFASRPVSRLIR